VAVRPDDIIAVQESHMASEGMDSYSVCPGCNQGGMHVLSTSATDQRFQYSARTIKFFCSQCQSVHDQLALAPMPSCPIPISVIDAMRPIPEGTASLISRLVDFETLERCARGQKNGKKPGSDNHYREFYKYGPTVYLELLWKAINAYLSGATPTVCVHEWTGAIVSYIPKKLSALLMTEFRPVACICAKYSILLKVLDERLDQVAEEYELYDDAQEGFRRCRSTKRQLCKLNCMLADQRLRRKTQSVLLFLDIKNAFNAVNHRAVFYILEASGFPEADVALFRRMYTGSFLVMVNRFGNSAVCILCRGMPQGAQPSPRIFNKTFDPVHAIVRASKRGCSIHPGHDPSGSSGFADDTLLHTDSSDAIPAMAIVVPKVADYLRWAGMEVNLKKSGISAIDFNTGARVATDSITLNGHPFPVIPPDQPHKHLGVRMTMTGDFRAEKEYVREEMTNRLQALKADRDLSRMKKELVIKIAVCSVFRYSAGIVD